ncbi:MAG: ABC transporter ATP-binding protein [Oscillospiraceae bacterium]|jgi:putative ABC transport system ATP-binding protein|nr:ABC transporter ATP-binding protein [Oscillospiraceae bacterium]
MDFITLEKVSKTYYAGTTPVEALSEVNFTVSQGDFVSIIGRSGSGKSTLMNIIGCLDQPTSGRYCFAGEDVTAFSDERLSRLRGREIGFVFQGFHLVPTLTAQENVELPLLYRGVREKQRQEMAKKALAKVGLSGRRDHRPQELSGGQQQRVAIARAIAMEPRLLLADEPTGNLDERSGQGILQILRELHDSGKTILLITHDSTVAKAAARQVLISDGVLTQVG